ncbi:MAG: hypothetical protein K8F91_14150 [Candidatus Obscuribacterales bacterium]|nr:hypothetical protein [Candidatus Obscuribacterales bacterium]
MSKVSKDKISKSLEESSRKEVVSLLKTVFAKFDSNEDEVLSSAEIDAAVSNGELSHIEAQIVTLFKYKYQAIKDLVKEGWFQKRNGITLMDMLVLEEVLEADFDRQLNTQELELHAVARDIMKRVAKIARLKRRLYQNEADPLASIRPIAVRQGRAGDCVFLASLAALAAQNPSIIEKSIVKNEDGTFTVTFAGAYDRPILIDAPNLVELALYAQFTRLGIWPCVIEKAYGVFLQNHGHEESVIPQENTSNQHAIVGALDLLTGEKGEWFLISKLEDERLEDILTSAFAEKRAIVAGSGGVVDSTTFDADILTRHAFSVIKWNRKLKTLVLRDPWGPKTRIGVDIDPIKDGVFAMDLISFRKNFLAIYIEQWAADPRYVDKPKATRKAIVRPK